MGRAMQLALTGVKVNGAPDNFMVRLTPDMVPGHIKSRKEAIRRWAQQNPDFVAKFQEERRKWEQARASQKKNETSP
jgi:hypothetical protein